MNRRQFIKSVCVTLAGGAALVFSGGCAPRVSPVVSEEKSQAWRCENCGHLTRSDEDLTDTRCPRCMRKGFMVRISEAQLRDYLKQ